MQPAGKLNFVEINADEIRTFSRLQGADIFSSEYRSPAAGCQFQCLAGSENRDFSRGKRCTHQSCPYTGNQHGLPCFGKHVRAVIAGRSIHTEPNIDLRCQELLDGGYARSQAHIG